MLQLAANQYLESVGDKYFVPSPNYLEWVGVNCLDIAIKRKPKWIWQKNKYFFDHMSINDLIDSPLPNNISVYLKQPEQITETFTWNSKHDISSKVGGGIASLVSLDISANDVVTVSIEMTGMEKQSIDYHAVCEALKTKKINLASNYIRNIANNKHNSIIMVTQYLYLTTKTEMKVSMNRDVSEKSSGTGGAAKVTVSDSGSFQFLKTKSIVFDVGTRMAFDFMELLIHADGSFDLLDRSQVSSKYVVNPRRIKVNKVAHSGNHHLIRSSNIKDIDKRGHLPMSSAKSNQPLDSEDSLSVTRDLLAIAINDKTALKELESFMQGAQGSKSVDLSVVKENRDPNISKLLKYIGVDTDSASPTTIESSELHQYMISDILEKINAIYHLVLPYLQNILSIIDEGNPERMTLLIDYLQNLKKDSEVNMPNREKLFQDAKYKSLLLTIGVTETDTQINKNYEPVCILLHGS